MMGYDYSEANLYMAPHSGDAERILSWKRIRPFVHIPAEQGNHQFLMGSLQNYHQLHIYIMSTVRSRVCLVDRPDSGGLFFEHCLTVW